MLFLGILKVKGSSDYLWRNHLLTDIFLYEIRQYSLKIKTEPPKIRSPQLKYENWVFFTEFWSLDFPMRLARSNTTIINSFGYPIINNTIEIRENFSFFPEYFYMTLPSTNFRDPHTKKYDVFL